MVDRVVISPGETVVIDTTNNVATVIMLNDGQLRVMNAQNIIYADMSFRLEMYTCPINTGLYYLINQGSSDIEVLIVREFVY